MDQELKQRLIGYLDALEKAIFAPRLVILEEIRKHL